MKLKIYSAILILISLLYTGCSDYLQLVPDSEFSLDGAYKTQTDFEQAIAGVYAQQQQLYRSNTCWFYGMIGRADETRVGAQYLYGLDNCTDDANNSWTYGQWNIYWKIIGRCNIILDKIEKGTFTDASVKSYITGEAYLLRAYSYWSLAFQFGGMPIIDKTLTVDEVRKISRSSADETFKFAESDYKNAINLLPESWSGTNAGRGTKYAAMGMLARMYMFQSNFAAAQPLLATVIASKKYSMETNYLNCYLDSKDNGPERVWEVQFTGGQLGEGNFLITGLLPEGFKDTKYMPFSGYTSALYVADSLYRAYEPGDKRRDISILKGWVNAGVKDTISKFVVKFAHYDAYVPKDQQDWANNLPILRYTDVMMMNAEALNELNYAANGEAFTILNAVRARAGLSAYTSATLPDKVAFRNAIIKERRVEFAFEGLRWMDMLRWGIATSLKNMQFAQKEQGSSRYKMEDFRKLLPIPFDEITRYNDPAVMSQNPGY
jgi:hypothetical protein